MAVGSGPGSRRARTFDGAIACLIAGQQGEEWAGGSQELASEAAKVVFPGGGVIWSSAMWTDRRGRRGACGVSSKLPGGKWMQD